MSESESSESVESKSSESVESKAESEWSHLCDQSRFLPFAKVPEGRVGIVGYSRVSTIMQAKEGMSIDAQVANIREYAARNEYVVKTICVDEGLSGSSADRPGLKLARLMLERGDIFVIPSLSRMTRNAEDAVAIKNELQSKGCGFMVLDVTIDLNDKVGQLVFGLLNQFNEFERKEIQGRVSVVMQSMARNGTLIKKPVYGYISMGKKTQPVPHPEEQRVVQFLLNEVEKDPSVGPAALARMLSDHPEFKEQTFRRNAKKWHAGMVRNIVIASLERSGKKPTWSSAPGPRKRSEDSTCTHPHDDS
jgi:DNA invertase Pin-like site-specific DNA recombinase